MPSGATAEFWNLIETDDLPDLGPGPRVGVLGETDLRAKIDPWIASQGFTRRTGNLFRAAALLWHDHHDAAHAIVQDDTSAEGSFLHAILHRREPDPANAGYWFRRVGNHPAYAAIAKRVTTLLEGDEYARWRDLIVPDGEWAPDAFVDAAYVANQSEYIYPIFQRVQRIEMNALLEHLTRLG